MASKYDVNVGLLATIGIVGALLVVIIVIGLQAWYYSAEQAETDIKREGQPVLSVANLRLEQEMNINTYHWINEKQQVAAIPIDEAMKLMVSRAATRPAGGD